MPTIHIRAFHQMQQIDAQEAAEELARDLAGKFDIDYGWDDDIILFERPGVQGSITVAKQEIRIEAELGLLLMMLKGRIEEEIRRYLRTHFNCTF